MLRTIRNRLIVSHILPTLIIVPLMGVLLIYLLENQLLLPSMSRELVSEGRFLAEIIRSRPEVWTGSQDADVLLANTRRDDSARVMLLSADGQLLASSDAEDAGRRLKQLDVPNLERAVAGEITTEIAFSQVLGGNVIDVLVPVIGESGVVEGLVRLSYRFTTTTEELVQMRFLIAGILVLGMLGGAGLGYVLALNLNSPIRQVTDALYLVSRGTVRMELPEVGPEEMRMQVQAVNHLTQRLHDLEESRKQLLANLIHELGRPLGALHTGLEALLRGAKDDPELMAVMLEGMEEELDRLQHLLQELSHLHRQVLGPLELDRQQVYLAEWLPPLLQTWKTAAAARNQLWRVTIETDLPIISVDTVRLGQAIGNLVSNALKYTPEGGAIEIGAGATEEAVWIRIADNGPGISIAEQEKIFTPFFRGSRRRIKQGMGLGLSIARDIVVAHEGRIELHSRLDEGTAFTIWLPRSEIRSGAGLPAGPRSPE